MKTAACVLVMNNEGEMLSVSRKYDESDWGLAGGKCEDGETPKQAAIRETLEETGCDVSIFNVDPFVEIDGDFVTYTYLGYLSGDRKITVEWQETGLVGFKSRILLESCSFGEYNKKCFKYFIN